MRRENKEYGPWALLSAEVASRAMCERMGCLGRARWTRTWRIAGMPMPSFEHWCRQHAPGLTAEVAEAARRRRQQRRAPDLGAGEPETEEEP